MKEFILIVLIIALALGISSCVNTSHHKDIDVWLKSHGQSARVVELCQFRSGPFFVRKNCMIYRVETESNVIYWFRYGMFYNGVYIETPDGNYMKVE